MKKGINILSVLPVRAAADHKSEMVNQLLFGESFSISEQKEDWIKITGDLDAYEGWITDNNVIISGDNSSESLNAVTSQVLRVGISEKPESSILLSPGSTLPNINYEEKCFFIGEQKYSVYGDINPPVTVCDTETIRKVSLSFLNAPYLWGGRNLFGIDCSGLAQILFKICGINLARDASQQVKSGISVNFVSEARPGDLAFFAKPDEDISHVGIILDEKTIIHASGKVRMDSFDQVGIYQKEKQNYSHYLRVINRYF